jgi:hypothetical protein
MGEAWSVYIVPKRPWRVLREAARALLHDWGQDPQARFGVAAFDPEHFVLQAEHHNGRYITVAGSEDSGSTLEKHLGGRVVELYGASNTDSVWVAAYENGRVVDTEDSLTSTVHRLKRFGIDLGRAVGFGGFGVSPSEMVEDWTLPLYGSEPDALQELRFDILLVSETSDTDAVAVRIEQAVTEGTLAPLPAVELLCGIDQTDRARAMLSRAPSESEDVRLAILQLCIKHGWTYDIAAWATDPDALPKPARVWLLEALGRKDEARALVLEEDREKLDATMDAVFSTPRCPWPEPSPPVRGLVYRAIEALRGLRALVPVPEGLLDELRATGVPRLEGIADEIQALAESVARDPIPHLRKRLQALSKPAERRPVLGRLALALDAADAPDALDVLVQAHAAYVPDAAMREDIAEALHRRGGPPVDEDEHAADVPGLPEPTPEAEAAFEALRTELAGQPFGPENMARLARARFDAGHADAAKHLENAYLALSYNSPMRGPLEEALADLGLF